MFIENIVKIVLAPTSRALEAKCLWSRTENILGCKNHQGAQGAIGVNTRKTHKERIEAHIFSADMFILMFSARVLKHSQNSHLHKLKILLAACRS